MSMSAPVLMSGMKPTTYQHALVAAADSGYSRVMAKRKTFTRVRSAITGRFVKRSRAKSSPRTTVTETFRRRGGKKKS